MPVMSLVLILLDSSCEHKTGAPLFTCPQRGHLAAQLRVQGGPTVLGVQHVPGSQGQQGGHWNQAEGQRRCEDSCQSSVMAKPRVRTGQTGAT